MLCVCDGCICETLDRTACVHQRGTKRKDQNRQPNKQHTECAKASLSKRRCSLIAKCIEEANKRANVDEKFSMYSDSRNDSAPIFVARPMKNGADAFSSLVNRACKRHKCVGA